MALGISISHIARTSPYAVLTTGYVDHPTGLFTASGNAVGLPDDTQLAYAVLKDPQHGPRVQGAIRGSQSTRGSAPSGSNETVTVTLARLPVSEGVTNLDALVGRQVTGQEAVLWETGVLNGVSYTLASPKIWRHGPVKEFHLGTQEARVTIQAPAVGLSEQSMDKWTGFGNGLLFADGGSGKVDWEVWDPSGSWTYSCLALLSQEQWDTGGGNLMVIMGNTETKIRWRGKKAEVRIEHATSGVQNITSDVLPRPERFYMLRAVYDDPVLSFYVDSTLIGSVTGVGARTTSGSTWVFGQSVAGASQYEGILGEFRFFSTALSVEDADSLEQGPMRTDEGDAYAYLPGWTDIAGTGLLDTAQKNSSSYRDGTITGATIGTLAGGNIRESSDDNADPGAETDYGLKPWPIGKCTHILGRALDADNNVFGYCDPERGIQDFLKIYQGGVEETITFRETSWLAFYAATLVSAGDCVVYPQAGVSRHHTLLSGTNVPGGNMTADVLGHGPYVRGLKLDGSTQYGDAATAGNSVFTDSFSIRLALSGETSTATVNILTNRSGSSQGIVLYTAADPVDPTFRLIGFQLHGSLTVLADLSYRIPFGRFSGDVLLSVERTGAGPTYDWDSVLYVDGLSSDTDSQSGAVTASTFNLYVGRDAGAGRWPGTVSNLEIYDTAKDATWAADKLHEHIAPFLDTGGAAVDLSGGLVALPLAGNPFVPGDSVIVAGTTNYNATEVLQTDPDPGKVGKRIVITATYNAETFDGTSTVKPSDLVHHYPGHDYAFPASTMTDEVGSLDFTLTGSPDWVGGVGPTTPRGLIAHVVKFAGQVGHKIDWTGASEWPSNPVDHVVKSR